MTGENLQGQADGEDEGTDRLSGSASGQGRVYQSRRDQHITHIDVRLDGAGGGERRALERSATAQQAHAGTARVISFLLGMVGALEDECAALKEEAGRARAAGRDETLAEIQDELQGYELKLMQVQTKLTEAQREREVAEELLIEAQRQAEEYRRAAEDLQQQRTARAVEESDPERPGRRELHEYDHAMEKADEELGQLREDLRRLGDQMSQRPRESSGEHVLPGEVVGARADADDLADDGAERRPGTPDAGPEESAGPDRREQQQEQEQEQEQQQGQDEASGAAPRGFLVTSVTYLVPPLPLTIVATAVMQMYAAEPSPAVIWSLSFAVIAGLAAVFLALFLLGMAIEVTRSPSSNRSSQQGRPSTRHRNGVGFAAFVSVCLAAYCLVNPDGFAVLGGTARFLAEYLGPL